MIKLLFFSSLLKQILLGCHGLLCYYIQDQLLGLILIDLSVELIWLSHVIKALTPLFSLIFCLFLMFFLFVPLCVPNCILVMHD